jgi:hypothetical protein
MLNAALPVGNYLDGNYHLLLYYNTLMLLDKET